MSQTPEASTRDLLGLIALYGDCSPLRGPNGPVNKTIDALAAANLLHDPEEVARGKEALEACVAYAEYHSSYSLVPASKRIHDLGRAELERRKPRPRWTAERHSDGSAWWVHERGADTFKSFPYDAEPEARAYVARKNAEEAK